MFTKDNYYSKTGSIDFSQLPEALRKGHEFVSKTTNNGADWKNYHASDTVKNVINTYFEKLGDYLRRDKKLVSNKATKEEQQQTKREIMEEAMHRQGITSKKKTKTKGQPKESADKPSMVERIPEEIRFIKRFVNLQGKTKEREELLRFINTLQKAIVEKKVRKSSPHAEQIKFIQDSLVDTYNAMGKKVQITIKQATYESLKKIANGEKVMTSVNIIKRYINMNEKPGMKQKAKYLLAQLNRAIVKKNIANSDPYSREIAEIKSNLEEFISNKSIKALQIEPNTLNGLEGILGCACQSLNGLDGVVSGRPTIMNSMDFANLRFKTIGLKGKWLEFIGDPSSNFTAMVFGKPKTGKSNLCIDFAGYLARNHGKVLYIAKEEGLDKTLQDKLNDKNVKHPNLYVASELPQSLSFYDFVFFDSVNKLGLKPDDLSRIKSVYPSKSLIYVFQTTKDGKFRGANTFQHDVDCVIEVPERGRAVQYGRFNQGGEISIF
jgi:hypothetical protein